MPLELWETKGNRTIKECGYCGFIWMEESRAYHPYGVRAIAVGTYNALNLPGFHSIPDYRLKPGRG